MLSMWDTLLGFAGGVFATWYILGLENDGKGWWGKKLFIIQSHLDKRRGKR